MEAEKIFKKRKDQGKESCLEKQELERMEGMAGCKMDRKLVTVTTTLTGALNPQGVGSRQRLFG